MQTLVVVWYLTFIYPSALMGHQFGPFENEAKCNIAKKAVVDAANTRNPGWVPLTSGVCFEGVKK
jgi:hypothetical protein